MPSCHKILITWTGIAGTPYLSTFFIDTSIIPDQADAADAVLGDLSTLISDLTDPLEFTADTEVTTYLTPSAPMGTLQIPPQATLGGQNAAQQLPHATQGLIKWDTGTYVGARRIKGRTFIPGFTENANTATGRPEATTIASMQAVANALIADGLCVASKKNDAFYRVNTAVVWDQWAVLRSRRD